MHTIGVLDHYTLIVEDAKSTLNFYTDVCGFEFISEIPINTGTVNADEHDMLNYILKLPGKEEQICVITQGLNERTMFSRYLMKFGPGIHHIAYRVNNIEKLFSNLKERNIAITSKEIVEDPIFGLKQFFIDKAYSGVVIEFIERTKTLDDYTFAKQNMRKLANTIKYFI